MNATIVIPDEVVEAMGATVALLHGELLAKLKALAADFATDHKSFSRLLSANSIIALLAASPGNAPEELPEEVKRAVAPLATLIARELPNLQANPGFRQAAC